MNLRETIRENTPGITDSKLNAIMNKLKSAHERSVSVQQDVVTELNEQLNEQCNFTEAGNVMGIQQVGGDNFVERRNQLNNKLRIETKKLESLKADAESYH